MSKLFPLCIVATSFLFLSAFKLFASQEERNTEAATKAADQAMVAAFWPGPFTKDPATQKDWTIKVYSDLIEIEQTDYLFAHSLAEFYQKTAASDSAADEIAAKYTEAAKARGNTVKLFKAPVNDAIYKLFRELEDTPKTMATLTDRDPALIEFRPEGRVVSALIRVSKAAPNLATIRRHYFSRIYLDPNHRFIENNLSNRVLEDNVMGVK